MSCKLTTNIISVCEYSTGGIGELFITNFDEIGDLEFSGTDFDEINNITGTQTWFPFSIEPTTRFNDSLVINGNGKNYTINFTLVVPKLGKEKRKTIQELTFSKVVIIFKDMNDKYWISGEDAGLKLSSFEETTGAKGDLNSITLNFTGLSRYQLRQISTNYVNTI